MSASNRECPICIEISLWRERRNPFVIEEFKRSIFVVGEHQFFEGYALLLLKEHVRDLHDLTSIVQEELFRELMIATKALVSRYSPWKMNYASYGNVVPHIHWHLIPRYDSDPDRESQPWRHDEEFADYRISPERARLIGEAIKRRNSYLHGQDVKAGQLFPVRQNSKYGFINETAKIVIQPKFVEAFSYSKGLAPVKIDDKWGYITETGKIAIESSLSLLMCFMRD